jgi:hypothetical protein
LEYAQVISADGGYKKAPGADERAHTLFQVVIYYYVLEILFFKAKMANGRLLYSNIINIYLVDLILRIKKSID